MIFRGCILASSRYNDRSSVPSSQSQCQLRVRGWLNHACQNGLLLALYLSRGVRPMSESSRSLKDISSDRAISRWCHSATQRLKLLQRDERYGPNVLILRFIVLTACSHYSTADELRVDPHILRWGCDRQHNFSLLPGKRFRKLPSVHEATGQPLANFHYDREQEPAPPHETFVSCMCLRPVGLTLRYVKRSPIWICCRPLTYIQCSRPMSSLICPPYQLV